jgi:uncharacterized membrane protein (UPF0182 family)
MDRTRARTPDDHLLDHDAPPAAARARRQPRWSLRATAVIGLSIALAAVLVVKLIDAAGAWAVAANTRVLDLLVRAGAVQLTDMDAGYVAGVPDTELYLRSQDSIDWLLVLAAVGLLVVVLVVRAVRFHALASSAGLDASGTRRVHVRTEALGRFLPFGLEHESERAALERGGAPAPRAAAAVALGRQANVAEVALFAVVALVLVGGRPWIGSLAWSGLILAVAVLLTRRPAADRRARRQWRRQILGEAWPALRQPVPLLVTLATTLVAIPLEELVAYVTVQALTSEHVILGGATPSVLLLAIVAGKLAALVPATPGGLGQFEWGMAGALVSTGQGVAEAVTITLAFTVVRYLAATAALVATGVRRPAAVVTTNGDGDARQPAPALPRLETYTRRLVVLGAVVVLLALLGRLRLLLVDYWLLESLGFEDVFWTNLRMGALLFVVAGGAWFVAVLGPWLRYRRRDGRLVDALGLAALAAVVTGTYWAGHYRDFLLLRHGVAFGDEDPVFGHDIGFYVFDLPALRSVVWGGVALLATALASTLVCRARAVRAEGIGFGQLARQPADWLTLTLVATGGALVACGLWLGRYDVLVKNNESSSIATGAEALDVTGLLSSVNLAAVQAIAALGLTVTAVVALRRGARRHGPARLRRAAVLAGPWLVLVLGASLLVTVRDAVAITPNEPVAQLEHLRRHIEATNRAWGLDGVELVDAEVNGPDDPLPDVGSLLQHPSLANVQLWPGAVSWLERLLDPQHVERITLEEDEREPDLVFGATLDTFRQQQKLRPYYDFLDVDIVRYDVDGQPTLMTSAVRELPLLEPQPWLAFWGQRFVLFTHGYGVVAAPIGQVSGSGAPAYASADIPPIAAAELATAQPSVYYGEGSGTIGFSNVRDVPELDYPTAQDRADVFLPEDVDAGIRLDSLPKRLAFAWGARELFGIRSFLDIALSDLITDETRIHYRRQPLDRVRAIAPFLFLDTDPYAVTAEDRITWMVNGMTVTDRYPYSAFGELGDKSVRRGPFPVEVAWVNYAADSVKATVDAYTGAVRLYQIADEPVVDTWAAVYPDLFTPAAEMPPDVRSHMQYPPQLFHVQFDDLWIYYHVTDPLAFFNQEDLFDDADEVLGPMHAPGKGITFSMEPYPGVVETGPLYPESERPLQFAWSQIFTPEGARNLRAIATVYQDGADYGRLSMLQFPKGSFELGPEQAESIIDQDAEIAQQFGFWNATGVEVIRGYLTPVIVEQELLYVEPVFIRSEQNPFPQLSRVVVVARGEAGMGATLEEALHRAYGTS